MYPKRHFLHRVRILSAEKTVGKTPNAPYILLVRESHATYRRRRLGALLVTAALAFAIYAGGNAGAESPPIHHTVEPGETLWEITVEHYPPSEDPRPIIEEIRETNGLEGYRINSGMPLELPSAR